MVRQKFIELSVRGLCESCTLRLQEGLWVVRLLMNWSSVTQKRSH